MKLNDHKLIRNAKRNAGVWLHWRKRNAFFIRQRIFPNFIFIHIQKCGGTSIEAACRIPVKVHDPARVRRRRVGEKAWKKAFKFTVVRHPYHRMVSHYNYRRRTRQVAPDDPIALNDWIYATLVSQNPKYFTDYNAFAPCFEWITDPQGNVILDYVAKLEKIESDWVQIATRIGACKHLPRLNSSSTQFGLTSHDLSKRSKEIIAEYFMKDIQFFEYDV